MACVDCVFDHHDHGVRLDVPQRIDSAVGNVFDGLFFEIKPRHESVDKICGQRTGR